MDFHSLGKSRQSDKSTNGMYQNVYHAHCDNIKYNLYIT